MQSLIWLLLAVGLGVAEAVTVDLVAIWFAVGALAAVIPALFHLHIAIQIIVFFAVSILSLIFFKPFAKKVLKTRKVSTNLDSTVGMMGKVIEDICPDKDTGRIHVNGLDWKASSSDGTPIAKGESVVVKSIKGVTAEVERI